MLHINVALRKATKRNNQPCLQTYLRVSAECLVSHLRWRPRSFCDFSHSSTAISMVKILANGEIVPDDDPRANSSSSNSRQRNPQPQRGGIPQSQGDQHQFRPGGQQVSLFSTINNQLLGFGIPRFNIGDTAVEPIVSVGIALAVIFFGFQGLLIGGLLFAVSQWSTNGPPDFIARLLGTQTQQQQSQQGGGAADRNRGRGGNGGGGGGGSGHRLGRD